MRAGTRSRHPAESPRIVPTAQSYLIRKNRAVQHFDFWDRARSIVRIPDKPPIHHWCNGISKFQSKWTTVRLSSRTTRRVCHVDANQAIASDPSIAAMTHTDIESIDRRTLDEVFSFVNVELADDSGRPIWTRPDKPKHCQHSLFLASCRLIRHVFDRPADISLLDVGCFEGGYVLEFARNLGCRAVGIEPRPRNFAACKIVERFHATDANIQFHQLAAHEFEAEAAFDVIFASGVLYHMQDPAAWIKDFAAANCQMLILNTHFADKETLGGFSSEKLSELCSHEGYEGRWYREYASEQAKATEQDDANWSSWGNLKSFFLLKGELVQCLLDAGFRTVFELYDANGRRSGKWMQTQDCRDLCRSTFVGIK